MNKAPIAFSGLYSQNGGAPDINEDWSKMKKTPAQIAAEVEKTCIYNDAQNAPFYSAHSQLRGAPLPCGKYQSPAYEPNTNPCNTWNNPNQCAFGCGAVNDPAAVMVSNPSLAQNLPVAAKNQVRKDQKGGSPDIRLPNNTLNTSLGFGPVMNNRVQCCNNNAHRPFTDRTSNIWYKQVCPPMNSGDCAGSGTIYGCGCGPMSYRQILKGTPMY